MLPCLAWPGLGHGLARPWPSGAGGQARGAGPGTLGTPGPWGPGTLGTPGLRPWLGLKRHLADQATCFGNDDSLIIRH